jgi:ribonuclease HI
MSIIDFRAIYIRCDAGMDYKPKSPGGIGVVIEFPEFINLEPIQFEYGKYLGAGIERLEIEAIIKGMEELMSLFSSLKDNLKSVTRIIVVTDRFGLSDENKTSAYAIRDWRKNKWKNFEEKSIKNQDLLDKLDKTRNKLSATTYCNVKIQFQPRRHNKVANKLSHIGKKKFIQDKSIEVKGIKQGRRKFDGEEIKYSLLKPKEEYIIHVFKKDPVSDQWEIHAEFFDGEFTGRKIKIYTDNKLERKLHRHHIYKVRIKSSYRYHIVIYKTIKEIKIENEAKA